MSASATEQNQRLRLQRPGVTQERVYVCACMCECDMMTALQLFQQNIWAYSLGETCLTANYINLFVFNCLSFFSLSLSRFFCVFCLVDSSVQEARHTKVQWFLHRKLRLRPSCLRPGLVLKKIQNHGSNFQEKMLHVIIQKSGTWHHCESPCILSARPSKLFQLPVLELHQASLWIHCRATTRCSHPLSAPDNCSTV